MKSLKPSLVYCLLILSLLLNNHIAYSQELEVEVEILSPQIQRTNKATFFNTMKTNISNFMNGTSWTGDKFENKEKIKVSLVITITKMIGLNDFNGNIQLAATRPVYNSNYTTTLIRIKDNKFDFSFAQFVPLQYQEGAFTDNLTQVLAFYSYIILGLDYDSFSEFGGSQYLTKALDIANAAQSAANKGWSASDKDRNNRYYLAFQLLNERFRELRSTYYQYHFKGMDHFTEDMDVARAEILKALQSLIKVHKFSPDSYTMQTFLDSKRQEILEIFYKSNMDEKNKLIKWAETLDVAKASRYRSKLLN